ncbi:MAG: hypothetical protein HYX53_13075 [Chloroflexi bacterium]|nr:hypothetical protein [Chloroflexota bacterium]
MPPLAARIAPNWTSAAGALEGVLAFLGQPLPRHAIMGLTGHAWHFCLGAHGGVVALPSGVADLDWEAMAGRYGRTGFTWERFGGQLPEDGDWAEMRAAAAAWAIPHLEAGRPLIGWDFHLHEHAVVHGYDRERDGFLVDDLLTGQAGPFVALADWPSALGGIELLVPIAAVETDPIEAVAASLQTALLCFAGGDGPADGQPRGTAGLEAWAEAFDAETEIDRAGNAYLLAVLQTARLDGAAFLADLAESLSELAGPLRLAERAIRDESQALAPLLTLFPFPSGGHGNVSNAGLRRGAAMAMRRAAAHERAAAGHIAAALALFE